MPVVIVIYIHRAFLIYRLNLLYSFTNAYIGNGVLIPSVGDNGPDNLSVGAGVLSAKNTNKGLENEVMIFSPMIADILALNTSTYSIEELVDKIIEVILGQ